VTNLKWVDALKDVPFPSTKYVDDLFSINFNNFNQLSIISEKDCQLSKSNFHIENEELILTYSDENEPQIKLTIPSGCKTIYGYFEPGVNVPFFIVESKEQGLADKSLTEIQNIVQHIGL